HFLNNLFYKLNRAEAELPTSVFGSAMMEVLTNRYSLDEISETPLEVLAADLNNLSHGRFGNAEEIAKALKRAVRNSYRLDKVMEDSVDVVLGMYADEIKMLSKQLKLLDKSIERICVAIPEVKPLLSIPGIGKIYAAGIIAELGQINRFKNEAQIAGYAGLTWRRSQSGESERQTTPLTHNGNQYLRYYLVEAANMVRINEPVFANYYKKKYSEVPKYQHRRAIVLSARKLIRLVYTLTTKHQLYQSPKMV
ncbi:transposase, partial [Pediococcus argentinicus]